MVMAHAFRCRGKNVGGSGFKACIPYHIPYSALVQDLRDLFKLRSGVVVVHENAVAHWIRCGRQEVIHRSIWIYKNVFAGSYMLIYKCEHWIALEHCN